LVKLTVVSRPLRTPDEMRQVSNTRPNEDASRKQGVAIDVVPLPGGDCRVYKKRNAPVTSSYVDAKGRGLVVEVIWPEGVAAGPVKPLVDKAVARLP
jgi:hypothetical protein